jgi:Ca2+-binding EF-hand superfamily protein
MLTRDECPANLASNFDKIDANADGKLSKDELTTAKTKMQGQGNWFSQQDKNGDGVLTRDECPAKLAPNFDKFDADADGKLTKEEITAARAKMQGMGNRAHP